MTPETEDRIAGSIVFGWLALWAWTVTAVPLELEHIKDELGHVEQVIRLLNGTAELSTADLGYPPLWRALAAVSGSLFGVSRAALALPGLICCLATVALAASAVPRRSRGRLIGFLAPALIPFSFRVTTEPVVVLAVAAAAAALVWAARAPSPIRIAWVGAAVAAALLAKQTTPLFLLVPLAWSLRTLARERGGSAILPVLGALGVAAALAWFGFYRHVGLAETVADALARATSGPTSAGSGLGRVIFYPGWLAVLLGGPLLLAAVRARRGDGDLGWLAASLGVPLAGLMAFPVQEPEYLIPVVPLAAVAIARTLDGATLRGAAASALIVLWAVGVSVSVVGDRALVAVYADAQTRSLDGLVEAWRGECPDGCTACVLTARRRGHAEALVRVGLRSRDADGLAVTGRCDRAPAGLALVFHGYDQPSRPDRCVVPEERDWYVGSFGGEPAWSLNADAFDAIAARGGPVVQLPQGPEGPPRITLCRLR
jgi:hypothetical protein